jgi:hypothetical protein
MNVGAIFLIASEVLIFLLPVLLGILVRSTDPHNPDGDHREISTSVMALPFIITNIMYFKRRWNHMATGPWPKA